ncbi:hypothetical protein [Frigoribacterium sp. CG_9.8]|uniref:hypothetical protein n=1 Tax=Frigoribacterium sp. CG_9.8 TaxID=2787733 RepID=UPI0018CB3679|nr:hypothetical protein [Frigoribacterium sp. CG_9.8]MBG6108623.1 hypothetical protein [Frigoribacterium sp. CG_9.8]
MAIARRREAAGGEEDPRNRQDRRNVNIFVSVYAEDHSLAVERRSRLSRVFQNG